MKTRSILCAALAATLGFGTAAQARDWNQDGGQTRGHDRAQQHQRGQAGHVQQQYQQPQYRQQTRQQYQQPQYQQGAYQQNYARSYPRTYTQPYAQSVYGGGYQGNYAPRYNTYNRIQYSGYAGAPRYWAGGYVPSQYRAQRYWVNDWRARHLYAPPYGYQWVQTDTGDVLLMALATGLIASAILSQ